MLLSMTGYGKGEATFADRKIIVEIKSLNSKNLDLSTHIAPPYLDKELALRQMVTASVVRGKVDLTVRLESSAAESTATISSSIVGSYIQQIRTISSQLGIAEPQDWWQTICRMPGIIQSTTTNETSDQEWAAISQATQQALCNFAAFRRQEGEAVQKKFEEKLDNIAAYLREVEKYEPQRTERIRKQITDRLDAINANYDRNRLEEEMIYYIEKLDINEEKQRLQNHLRYFAATMAEQDAASQGKKLGFIAQEMGREINTLGSKSNHAEMQNLVVKMKDELEQIKEQVLNVL